MVKTLGGFHHRVARYLIGKLQRRLTDGDWFTPQYGRLSEGGGDVGDDSVHRVETEYNHAVHLYAAKFGAFLGGGGSGTASGAVRKAVMVTGGDGSRRSTGGIRVGKDRWGG